MTASDLTVNGRRFRTRADYEAALRDQKKIEGIKAKVDLNNPRQLYELFGELQSGAYRFETPLGNDFDDAIYEKVEGLKKQGITAENAGKSSVRKKSPSVKSKTGTSGKEKKSSSGKKSKKGASLEAYDKEMQKGKTQKTDHSLCFRGSCCQFCLFWHILLL